MRLVYATLLLAQTLTFGSCRTTGGIAPSTPADAHIQEDPDCMVIRGGFDVGSGTTRLKVAVIDVCLQRRVGEYLFSGEEAVPYRDDLANEPLGQFGSTIQSQGIAVIKKLQAAALASINTHHSIKFAGVATSAFRDAGNSDKFIDRIARETAVSIKVISSEEESQLGYWAAAAVTNSDPKSLVVWDIGAGSMQITAMTADGEFTSYASNMAAVTMKEKIIDFKKVDDPTLNDKTPNPVRRKYADLALAVSASDAAKVPFTLQTLLAQSQVYGIGGVHYHSVRGQIGNNSPFFTQKEVFDAIDARIDLGDMQLAVLKDPAIESLPEDSSERQNRVNDALAYINTDVSNLILVGGFMSELGISKISTLQINMADGCILDPKFWF